MIEIQDLSGLTIKEIRELILGQKEQEIEVYIPKETQKYFSTSSDIAIDYLHAAFAGQKLFELTKEITYHIMSTEAHESILFKLKCSDSDELASVLLDISYLYVNDHPDPEYIAAEEVQCFLDDVKSKKIIPACPDFIEIYEEYLEEVGKEDDDEEEKDA